MFQAHALSLVAEHTAFPHKAEEGGFRTQRAFSLHAKEQLHISSLTTFTPALTADKKVVLSLRDERRRCAQKPHPAQKSLLHLLSWEVSKPKTQNTHPVLWPSSGQFRN